MTPPREDERFEDFWQDVRLELLPDPIPQAEAARRMDEVEAEPMVTAEIDAIVAGVLAREAATLPSPAAASPVAARERSGLGRLLSFRSRWTQAAAVAAVSLAGLALWPENKYPAKTLPYSQALRILGDSKDTARRRLAAVGVVLVSLKRGIATLNSLQRDTGVLGAVSEGHLGVLRALLDSLSLPRRSAAVSDIRVLSEVAKNPLTPRADRRAALEKLGAEAQRGLVGLLATSRETGVDPLTSELGEAIKWVRKWLDR